MTYRSSMAVAAPSAAVDLFALKAADQSKSNDIVLADDSELVITAIPVDTVWVIEGHILADSASDTPDISIGLTATDVGAVAAYSLYGPSTTTTGASSVIGTNVRDLTGTVNRGLVATEPIAIRIKGVLRVIGNPTDLAFQWAQANSNGTASTVLQDSWLKLTPVTPL